MAEKDVLDYIGLGGILSPGYGERQRRDDESADNRARWDRVYDEAPDADDLSVTYEDERTEGMRDNEFLGSSQEGHALADASSVDAQRAALRGLQDVYAAGGYTGAEQRQNQAMQRDLGRNEAGRRGAIMQQAQSRGLGGSGMQLAAQLSSQQGTANRAADMGAQFAIAGQQRALQALQASGQVAGQMRGQSFGEASQRGAAVDRFNQSNTDWRRNHGQYRRGVGARNTDRHNNTRDQNAGARQDAWRNRADATAGVSGQYRTDQGREDRKDEQQQAVLQNVIGAVL